MRLTCFHFGTAAYLQGENKNLDIDEVDVFLNNAAGVGYGL